MELNSKSKGPIRSPFYALFAICLEKLTLVRIGKFTRMLQCVVNNGKQAGGLWVEDASQTKTEIDDAYLFTIPLFLSLSLSPLNTISNKQLGDDCEFLIFWDFSRVIARFNVLICLFDARLQSPNLKMCRGNHYLNSWPYHPVLLMLYVKCTQ